jgi:hypothetical protein
MSLAPSLLAIFPALAALVSLYALIADPATAGLRHLDMERQCRRDGTLRCAKYRLSREGDAQLLSSQCGLTATSMNFANTSEFTSAKPCL